MSDAWIRFGRVLVSLALGGWFTALLVMVPDDSWTLAEAAFSMAALKAATAGAVTGILFSPILVFRRMPAWVGAPMGLLAGLGGIWFFFFLWPHDWQAGRLNADKSLGLFLSVYWRSLLPTFLAVGVATTAIDGVKAGARIFGLGRDTGSGLERKKKTKSASRDVDLRDRDERPRLRRRR